MASGRRCCHHHHHDAGYQEGLTLDVLVLPDGISGPAERSMAVEGTNILDRPTGYALRSVT